MVPGLVVEAHSEGDCEQRPAKACPQYCDCLLTDRHDGRPEEQFLLNTLQLKLHGLTDAGIDAQALLKLGQCSRNLRKDRDILAEVQEKLLILESQSRPIQLTLDNCDTKSNNCTVAFVQTETVDTSHLGTEPMSPEETLSLFDLNLLDLNRPDRTRRSLHL